MAGTTPTTGTDSKARSAGKSLSAGGITGDDDQIDRMVGGDTDNQLTTTLNWVSTGSSPYGKHLLSNR